MKALILVDFQNEWTNKDSEYYLEGINLDKVNEVLKKARSKYKIIFIKHVELEGEEFTNDRAELLIKTELTDTIITKHKISPFYQTNLEKELEGIEEIVVCGILTNLCVRSIIQDAYDRDFDITVIKDCCFTYEEETQEFTFKDLKETREEIQFINSDDFQ